MEQLFNEKSPLLIAFLIIDIHVEAQLRRPEDLMAFMIAGMCGGTHEIKHLGFMNKTALMH
jgi:hypothetical protein